MAPAWRNCLPGGWELNQELSNANYDPIVLHMSDVPLSLYSLLLILKPVLVVSVVGLLA